MSNIRMKLEEQIIGKAVKDDLFRARLIEDPKTVFEQEMGIILPETLKINILQEDKNNVYLILPALKVEDMGEELTEQELAAVAAGGTAPGETCDNSSWPCRGDPMDS